MYSKYWILMQLFLAGNKLEGFIAVLHAKVISPALSSKSHDQTATYTGYSRSHDQEATDTAYSRSNDQEATESLTDCLFLGRLDLSLHLMLNNSYGDKFNRYSTTLHAPDGGSIHANCSSGRAGVVLLSDDKQVGVSIVFEEQNETDADSWVITQLAVVTKDDVDNYLDKDVLSKRGFERTPGLLMFKTPYNRTVVCDTNQRVVFHGDRAQASIVFSHVNLQPPIDRRPWAKAKGFICPEPVQHDTDQARNAQIFVPVILSVSLAVVVSLLVIGYLIHRKIEGMGYSSMD